MSIVSLCYLSVFTQIMQVSTSVIAEFKSKPIITPESLMVTRPYMGKCCSCMPISQVMESDAYMNSEKIVFSLYLISLNVCYYFLSSPFRWILVQWRLSKWVLETFWI